MTERTCASRYLSLLQAQQRLTFLQGKTREQKFDTSLYAWGPINDQPCWLWSGWTDEKGYGRVRWRDQGSARVHRVTFEELRFATDLVIDHLCRVRHCCNPWHGQPVTVTMNTQRGARADGVCRNGLHLMEGENVITRYRDGLPRYECLACKLLRR